MNQHKRSGLILASFLLIGLGFSNGLKFKKNKVIEEVIEYDEVVRKVKRVKRIKRVPASNEEIASSEKVTLRNNNHSSPSAESYRNDAFHADTDPRVESASSSYVHSGYIPMNGSSGRRFGSSNNDSSSSSTSTPSASKSSTSSAGVMGGSAVYSGSATSAPTNATGTTSKSNKGDTTAEATVSFSISSISIKEGKLILKGSNLTAVKNITVSGNTVSASLVKTSSSASELIAMGLSGIQLAMGKIYNLVISDAYASSTFPIEIELADGSVTPTKLAPVGASQDGYVLKWDAVGQTWVTAPDDVGVGPDGGITSITKGVGIVGEGAVLETTGSIAVDVGFGANQIPQFDADKKLVLNNTNVIELNETSTLNFKENAEEFVFGMFSEVFKLRNKTSDTTIFEVVGNDLLVSGRSVCLSDGTNCPTTGGDYVDSISTNPPLSSSGTNSVTLSLGMDNSTIGLNGSNQLTVLDGGITALKLNNMGADPGQILKWNGAVWEASDDLDSGITTESDPKTRNFAHKDQPVPPTCDPHQTLSYVLMSDALECVDIILNSTQTDQVVAAAVADAISDGTTDIAPSQNAVFDALATKQDTIDATSDITMKYLKLMTDGAFWVGLKAPALTAANVTFTLPAADGDAGQVLKTDGLGNLGWVDATAGTVTSTRILTAGTALSGGGDLSADRTFNVNYDDSTIGINGSDQLIVKNGGITNNHINATAAIEWIKINKTGANPTDIGAASILTSILAGTGLTGGGTLSADRTLNVDVGTTAGKIVQLDGSGRLPAVDGSQLTNLGTNLGKWSDATGGIHYSSGNVGIGTNNPPHKLTVQGNHLITTNDYVHGSVGSALWLARGAATGNTHSLIQAYHNGAMTYAPLVINPNGGNVGIGTFTPQSSLDVAGTIRATELCDETGGNCKDISSGWGASSSASMIANWPDAIVCDNGTDKSVMYHDTSAGNLEYYGKASGPHWIRFNATTGAYYDVTAGMAGSSICTGKSISTLIAEGRTFGLLGGGVDWTSTNGTDVFRAGGRVGIGTTVPSTTLEVSHSDSGHDGTNVSGLFVENSGVSNSSYVFQTATTGGGKSLSVTNGGNVGIGTTTPSGKVHAEINETGAAFKVTDSAAPDGYLSIVDAGSTANTFAPIIYARPSGSDRFTGIYSDVLDVEDVGTTPTIILTGRKQSAPLVTRPVLAIQNHSTKLMTVLANGNVGIGTTTPSRKLHVISSEWDNANGAGVIFENPNAIGAGLTLKPSASAVANGNLGWAMYAGAPTAAVGDGNFGLWAHGEVANPKMTVLRASGNVGIGTTTPSQKLHVIGNILASGTITPSDRRLKKNFKPIENALEKINGLQAVSYDWKEPEKHGKARQIGVIAQEVKEAFPEAVIQTNDGFLAVSYSVLVSPLIAAVKELYGKVLALYERVNVHEEHISTNTREIATLKAENARKDQEMSMMKSYICHKDPTAPFCKK